MITGMAIAEALENEQAMTIRELLTNRHVHFGYCGVRKAFVAWYRTPRGRVEAFGDSPLESFEGLLSPAKRAVVDRALDKLDDEAGLEVQCRTHGR